MNVGRAHPSEGGDSVGRPRGSNKANPSWRQSAESGAIVVGIFHLGEQAPESGWCGGHWRNGEAWKLETEWLHGHQAFLVLRVDRTAPHLLQRLCGVEVIGAPWISRAELFVAPWPVRLRFHALEQDRNQ